MSATTSSLLEWRDGVFMKSSGEQRRPRLVHRVIACEAHYDVAGRGEYTEGRRDVCSIYCPTSFPLLSAAQNSARTLPFWSLRQNQCSIVRCARVGVSFVGHIRTDER